jgi:hypothetical protein
VDIKLLSFVKKMFGGKYGMTPIDTAHPGSRTVSNSVFDIAANLWKGKDSSCGESELLAMNKSIVERLEENPNTFSMVLIQQPRGIHGDLLKGTGPKLVEEITKHDRQRRVREICIDSDITPAKVQPDAHPKTPITPSKSATAD